MSATPPRAEPDPAGYIPESRFGNWFQRSDIWREYVVDEAIAELAALLPAGSVPFRALLDAGCGEGAAFAAALGTFAPRTMTAVDIDRGSVEAAARHAAQLGGRIEVRRADARRLPYATGTFDLVLCHQLLHHTTEPGAVLAELARVAAPGGWLLVAESCRAFLAWWPVRLLFRHPPRAQQTAEEYVALIEAAGFSVGTAGVSTPTPFWSVPDIGLRERLGLPARAGEPRQVRIAAQRRAA
ncbi:MAG TPA: class I SAM-dependent methyltransferase [Steroidobacteraceae bacterium]|nr:class I SAM-dependent methyltransferase [Steroidobacteraceae bacterium]